MFSSVREKSGFTLIELMVVITIIGILFAASYLPYEHYSRLSRVRISAEKLRQAQEDAKVLSQNGQVFPGTSKNADIGLLFQKGSHTVNMFAFMPGFRSFSESENAKILKTVSLEDGVNITTLPQDVVLVEYRAPKWEMEIYTTPTSTGSAFDLGIGWKQVESWVLYRSMKIEK